MRELNKVHLTGLRAVEAVGRLGTVHNAAEELGVTPGAVSQRIQKTEAALGCKLFKRTSKGLLPNEMGEKVVQRLTDGMASLASAITIIDQSHMRSLTVSVMPVFANRWLVWRLPRFTQQYPDIRIQIESDDRNIHPDRLQTDVSIRLREEPWSGVTAELLLEQKIFPVCSPELASRISTPSHLKSVPIIRGGFLHDAWDRWLQPYEMTDDMLPNGPTFTDPSVCLDAALSGQGVYVASEILACQAIECGHLIELFNDRRSTGYGLWSVVGKASVRKKGVQQFQSWMKEEMSHSISSWRRSQH